MNLDSIVYGAKQRISNISESASLNIVETHFLLLKAGPGLNIIRIIILLYMYPEKDRSSYLIWHLLLISLLRLLHVCTNIYALL